MPKTIDIKGDKKAIAVLERAGQKATDQRGSLSEASHVRAIEQGGWENISGELTGSLDNAEVTDQSLQFVSAVPYARYVFYGTEHQAARPPKVHQDRLVQAVVTRVANDIVGEH